MQRSSRVSSQATVFHYGGAALLSPRQVLLCGGNTLGDDCFYIDPVSLFTTDGPSLTISLQTFTMLYNGSEVFTVDGDSGGATNRVFRLRDGEKNWEEAPSMHVARYLNAAVLYEGSVYAIGGYDGSNNLESVESMDLRTGLWVLREPLPVGLRVCTAAVYNNSIYHCGGYGGSDGTKSCYVYSSSTGVWTPGPEMNHARWYHGLVVVGGDLYEIGGGGGSDSQTSSERLNSRTGKWELLSGQLAMSVYASGIVVC